MLNMRYKGIGIALLLLCSGCASYTPSSAPVPSVAAADWHTNDNLAVAVYPIVGEEQEQMLDADLNEVGVLALQVVLENRGEYTKVVRSKDMVLTLPDERTFGPTTVDSVVYKVDESGSVIGSTVAFGLIGYMAASSAEESAKKARLMDYRAKSLGEEELAANDSAHGFVFFIPPPGSGTFDEATLSVFFVNEDLSTAKEVRVPVKGIGFEPEEVTKAEESEKPE